jgi:tetratricopeptide (TPR) repeat protein
MDNEVSDLEDLFDEGLNRFNADKYGDAIRIFTKVLQIDPEHSDALYYRAIAWTNKGNFEQAIADFTEAVKNDPYDTDAWFGRGEAWQGKGDVKRALADFKKALNIDPGNPDYKRRVSDLEEK